MFGLCRPDLPNILLQPADFPLDQLVRNVSLLGLAPTFLHRLNGQALPILDDSARALRVVATYHCPQISGSVRGLPPHGDNDENRTLMPPITLPIMLPNENLPKPTPSSLSPALSSPASGP